MSEKPKNPIQLNYPKNDEAVQVMLQPLVYAIGDLLDEVAALRGDVAGPWLDELKEQLLRDAKSHITEGIDITVEAEGFKAAIEVLDALVERLRRRLIVEKEE